MPTPAFLPINIGVVHFIGIGGIGMSGIAEVMHSLGYKVQGSDIKESDLTRRLKSLGIPIFIGHSSHNVDNSAFVVYSNAVSRSNPELQAAINSKKHIVKRAEMLAELMRHFWSIAIAGTHGKTTTTSLTATVLEGAGLDPTVINGGIINKRGVNAWLGNGHWIITEADESDGSFLRLPATIGVITNIDDEHLDFYKNSQNLSDSFKNFLENIPFYGLGIVCIDSENVEQIIQQIHDRRIITYGFHPNAMFRAQNVQTINNSTSFNIIIQKEALTNRDFPNEIHITMPMLGLHNVQNALATIAVASEIGIESKTIIESIANFKGVKRRFSVIGKAKGITFIDDYAHHPVEIIATISSARLIAKRRVVAVFQPHRFSRVHHLYSEFIDAFRDVDAV